MMDKAFLTMMWIITIIMVVMGAGVSVEIWHNVFKACH